MSALKLHELHLKAFRGATVPAIIAFDPAKALTMVFGENGSGKSSIVDGFSFLCNQDLGSITDRSSYDAGYVTSITGEKKDVSVKLVADVGTWEAVFKGASPEVKPPKDIPNARVLRRARILRLVDAEPNARYKALGEYIELRGVAKTEDTLRTAEKNVKSAAETARSKWEQADKTLSKLWATEGKPGADALTWGKAESERDLSVISADLETVKALRGNIGKLETCHTEWTDAKTAQATTQEKAEKAAVALAEEEAKAAGQNSGLVSLLQEAKAFVDANGGSDCPVCQQNVDRTKLSGELQSRITTMEKLKGLADAAKDANKAFADAKAVTGTRLKSYAQQVRAVAAGLVGTKIIAVKNALLPQDVLSLLTAKETTDEDAATHAEKILAAVLALPAALKADEEAWQKTVNLHASIKTQYETVVAQKAEMDAKDELAGRLSKALQIVVTKRKAFVSEELASISEEVARLYGILHPGEDLGHIKLTLDPKTQGSLLLTGKFYTEEDITPQSLFSESHLDTLGFSVFFALAKKYKTEHTIIILDDVVTSVDEAHLDRFIGLLHDEAKHFSHIIVTTHYRPWRERYRFNRAPGGKMHFVDLRPWSIERGIRAQNAKLAVDELRYALDVAAFNRRDIANQAGILVESLLDFLTLKFFCKLARKTESGYTLRELSDALPKELLKVLKIEAVTVVVNPDKSFTETVVVSGGANVIVL